MNLKRFRLPLITFAFSFAMLSAAEGFGQAVKALPESADRGQRVLASGRLTGTRELQQVVSWQTRGVAHLAIRTPGPRPRILWQTGGGNGESRVASVRVSDLGGDGIPEIIVLWRKGSSFGAVLRVIHWERSQNTFAELQYEDELNNVRSYRIIPAGGNRSTSRIVINTRSETNPRRQTSEDLEYELRGSKLVRVRGGRVVTTQGESGIEGQAVISPAHPGPLRQGMSGTAPYKTTLVVWGAGDQEVTRLETGPDGRFRVALPPGTYRVGPPQRAGRFLPRGSEETVTVEPGKFVQVTINFDSGMR